MNIGLILLLGSFLVGADKENSEKPTEQPKSNNEKITLNEMVVSKNNQDDLSEIKSNNKEPIQNKNISPSFVNRNPSLRGEPKTTIKQDEHYSFMVQASDPENDKLSFVISNKPNLDSTKITEIKKEIMNTISDSWEKNSALMFHWREDDWDAMQNGKGQLFKWDSPSNCAENYTAEYAQVKVYIKQKEEVESKQAENRFTINLNVKADGSFVDAYPKHRIIHEFGHALGFPDENKRFDIFTGDLTKKSIESWHSWECVKSMNIQKPSIATENDLISTTAVMEISYKEWQQQPYDSYSIMDECIFDNPSAYENSASNLQTDMLTINDKKRVQQFYGAPIIETESPHLINDDQFFTGLFLHGNDYFYYGNGVKSSNDRFINTRTVKMFFDTGGIYISALSSDINEDVLFKKTYDGDSPPSFISPFPSLLITCPEGQDDSNGFRYRHAGKCKSPDNLIADNESVYYFYDDPQSIKFYSCATDANNSSKTNNCSEINNSWLVSDGVLFAKGIKNNATYLYKKY